MNSSGKDQYFYSVYTEAWPKSLQFFIGFYSLLGEVTIRYFIHFCCSEFDRFSIVFTN